MRSRFVDKYNHDEDALDYDKDVLNERNPIRSGYFELLDWVVSNASVDSDSFVVDLGTGTANLAVRLPIVKHLICVDASSEMLRLARKKLTNRENVEYRQLDILEFFDQPPSNIDAVISTYAIHHLLEDEKALLFRKIVSSLKPGGAAVFGDLMFSNEISRRNYLESLLRSGKNELALEIGDEFFWNIESARAELEWLGFEVVVRQVSELSWGVAARKRPE